jgi:hypothetical protein
MAPIRVRFSPGFPREHVFRGLENLLMSMGRCRIEIMRFRQKYKNTELRNEIPL